MSSPMSSLWKQDLISVIVGARVGISGWRPQGGQGGGHCNGLGGRQGWPGPAGALEGVGLNFEKTGLPSSILTWFLLTP